MAKCVLTKNELLNNILDASKVHKKAPKRFFSERLPDFGRVGARSKGLRLFDSRRTGIWCDASVRASNCRWRARCSGRKTQGWFGETLLLINHYSSMWEANENRISFTFFENRKYLLQGNVVQCAPKVWTAFTFEFEVVENGIILRKRYETMLLISFDL